jgi:hypothetical protein
MNMQQNISNAGDLERNTIYLVRTSAWQSAVRALLIKGEGVLKLQTTALPLI